VVIEVDYEIQLTDYKYTHIVFDFAFDSFNATNRTVVVVSMSK